MRRLADTLRAVTGWITLKNANQNLPIASNGLSIRLNGQPYGPVKPGDQVVLSSDGKLTIRTQSHENAASQ